MNSCPRRIHRSTRITNSYAFDEDAYGNPIAFTNSQALTNHLNSGEWTDTTTGWQYLRARYYDPQPGRFNRLDPFAGNAADPLSLHKYLFVHADPIHGIDPTGKFGLVATGIASSIGATLNSITAEIGAQVLGTLTNSFVAFDAFGLAVQAASYLIPQHIKDATLQFFAGIDWGYVGKIAGATAIVGATALGVSIGVSQYNTARASVLSKIASQADMVAQLARIKDFPDVARAGKLISRKEAIGIARFEQVTGVVASAARHKGHDFVAPGIWKNVSLKGPLLRPNGSRFPFSQTNIDDLFAAVVAPNHAADSIVIDLLGFSPKQADEFVARVQAVGLTKPVLFINP